MTILFVGGEMGAFIPADSQPIEDIANASARYNSSFARCSTTVRNASYIESSSFASAQQDIWVHFETARGSGSSNVAARILEVVDNAGVPVFKVEYDTTGAIAQMYRWTGAAFVAIGGAVSGLDGHLQTFDIHIEGDSASGTATLYVAGTERATGTADLSAVDDMVKIRHYGRAPSPSDMAYSQVIVATGETTIGMRLVTFSATGAGATSQLTGSYASIDEIPYSDGDFIFSDTPNQVSVFAGAPVGALTGYNVRAVGVTARANTDGTGPQNIQMAVRSGSTNYFGTTQALDAGMRAFCHIWETDPATTLPWTNTDAAAIQFGVKSIA